MNNIATFMSLVKDNVDIGIMVWIFCIGLGVLGSIFIYEIYILFN